MPAESIFINTQDIEMEKTTSESIFWDTENEIVVGVLVADIKTVDSAIENINAMERVRDKLNKEKIRVLIDMYKVNEITKEARDYFANERTASIQRVTALYISSPMSKIIGNFFMGLNKPKCPTKLFTDPQEAIDWLHTFRNA